MKVACAYYRVSTGKQGRSGLGLEAQQVAVKRYCASNDFVLLRELQEVKSTRKHRPRLQEALIFCQQENATLMVACLDRLGRDVEEIAHNVKLPVDIIVADNPHADRFTIHILAAVAEEQRRTISINTKAALAAAKRKGKKLGKNGIKLSKKNKKAADQFAKKMKPVIKKVQSLGFTSLQSITEELNRRHIPTFRQKGQWHKRTVYNLVLRQKDLNRT